MRSLTLRGRAVAILILLFGGIAMTIAIIGVDRARWRNDMAPTVAAIEHIEHINGSNDWMQIKRICPGIFSGNGWIDCATGYYSGKHFVENRTVFSFIEVRVYDPRIDHGEMPAAKTIIEINPLTQRAECVRYEYAYPRRIIFPW